MDNSAASGKYLGFRSASTTSFILPESGWNLVKFLYIAQTLSVDLLPITWHSALEQAGIGATATLRERLVNVSLRLLFKRVHPRHFPQLSRAGAEQTAFKLLASEIRIARHFHVDESDYLINLEGISWDVEDDGRVWPVLVYEKAKFGSMRQFFEGPSVAGCQPGALLSFSDKVQLCAQIAKGIATLHKAAIIHGDIKPDNILVFTNPARELTAKLTDFGFSTYCLSPENDGRIFKEGLYFQKAIFLTKGSFWSHPLRHENGYTFEQAVLEEVYSFGMSCFWILFGQSTTFPTVDEIKLTKEQGKMPAACLSLAGRPEMSLNRDQLAFLTRLFDVTLAHNAHRRCTFQEIVCLFDTNEMPEDNTTQTFEVSIPTNSAIVTPDFSLIRSLGQLLATDYRVRAHIRKCFLDMLSMEDKMDTELLRRIHYGVACCYELGFGGPSDQGKRDFHLHQARSSVGEIEDELRAMNATKGVSYNKGQFRTAMESGSIPPLDMVQALRDVRASSDIASLMQDEVQSIEQVLGAANTHVIHMKSMLANLYWEQGRIKPARDMLLACLHTLEKNAEKVDDWDLLWIKGEVAEAETRMGNWATAETLLHDLVDKIIALGGEHHAETVVVKNQLALALADLGKWDQAVPVQRELVEVQKQRLGEDHPLTLRFMSSLLQSLIELEEYKDAEEIMDHIKKMRASVWGDSDQDTLLSLMDEARLLEAQGRCAEAEVNERLALELCQQSLEEDHPYTLDCMINLSMSLVQMLGIEEAEDLAERSVGAYIRVRGEDHPDTLRSRSSLAMVYKESGKWREAERQDFQAYEGLKQVLGHRHPFTLASMHGLGQDYFKLNKVERAEELLAQALEDQIVVLGENHRDTLDTMVMLGNVYAELERLEDAITKLECALTIFKRKFGDGHRDTLIAAMNLATAYDDAGHAQKAVELEEKTLEKAKEQLEPHDTIILTLTTHLASSYMTSSISKPEEGLRLAEEAVNLRIALGYSGGDAEALADARNILAQVYTRLGKHKEAKDTYQLALASKSEMFGDDHPDTLWISEQLQELEEVLSQTAIANHAEQ